MLTYKEEITRYNNRKGGLGGGHSQGKGLETRKCWGNSNEGNLEGW